jgi:hypothetical protein
MRQAKKPLLQLKISGDALTQYDQLNGTGGSPATALVRVTDLALSDLA